MGKMKALAMDLEEQFIDEVAVRIGGCESIDELIDQLDKDKCFENIVHLSGPEKDELVYTLWNDFWSEYNV